MGKKNRVKLKALLNSAIPSAMPKNSGVTLSMRRYNYSEEELAAIDAYVEKYNARPKFIFKEAEFCIESIGCDFTYLMAEGNQNRYAIYEYGYQHQESCLAIDNDYGVPYNYYVNSIFSKRVVGIDEDKLYFINDLPPIVMQAFNKKLLEN